MNGVELVEIEKRYGKTEALKGVSLQGQPGEIVALLGPSGTGKSTTLRIAAGVDRPSSGRVVIGGVDVTDVAVWKRKASMVFESYVLYPHVTVFDNIASPLRASGRGERSTAAEIERRVREAAEVVEIDQLLERRPAELSGGQRQRVALARALVRESSVFLLDEPIAHLDAKLRHWLRGELRRRLRETEAPTLWATPDSLEAMAVADRVAILVAGSLEQVGTPVEVYRRPATTRVAELLGDPPMNVLLGEVDGEEPAFRLDGAERPLPARTEGGGGLERGRISIGVRPGSLRIAGSGGRARLKAHVLAREFGSRHTVVTTRLGEQLVRVKTHAYADVRVGDDVWLDWAEAPVYVFAGSGGELRLQARIDAGPTN